MRSLSFAPPGGDEGFGTWIGEACSSDPDVAPMTLSVSCFLPFPLPLPFPLVLLALIGVDRAEAPEVDLPEGLLENGGRDE